MNNQDLVFLDFETTGTNPNTCQPIQLAALVIHGRKLEIHPDSEFKYLIKPIFDEEKCAELNLDPVNDEVLSITGITLEELEKAPSLKTVWEHFQEYISKYNPRKSKWGAPIKTGYNIDKYDGVIIDRICGGHFYQIRKQLNLLLNDKEIARLAKQIDPYGFGPWDSDRQEETLFFPRDSVDLMRIVWMWTENNPDITSLSMDSVRDWLGIDATGAHKADKDVRDGANILIRFLNMHRKFVPNIKFKGSFNQR
jgi:DNA polymerase III alpha subunit (gram-positive type)